MALLLLAVALAVVTAMWWRTQQQLKRKRAACDELVATIAHDARSPLLVIAGIADVKRLECDSPELRDAFIKIVLETKRLGRILENHMAAVVLAGGVRPRREWIPLEEIVATVLARLAPAYADRVDVQITGDAIAHVDPRLAEIALGNLLEIAGRRSPADARIRLAGRRDDHAIVVEIADRHQGEDEGDRKSLALCRAIAAAYGGSFEVTSHPDTGTSVRLRIPDGGPMLLAEPVPEVI